MRLLHTMLRVGNLDKSIDFYTNVLGMRVLRRNDYPDGKFTLAFVGYQDEAEGAVIELTHNWDTDKYDLGSGYGHIALEVDNAYEACDKVKERGGKITREAGPMKHGTTVIAFVEDPDGYKIEFIQKKAEWTDTHDPHHPEDGRPRLLRVAAPVAHFGTPELRALVADMFETMAAAQGVDWPRRRSAWTCNW